MKLPENLNTAQNRKKKVIDLTHFKGHFVLANLLLEISS
mgnify:CR=1 FL=1